MKIIICGGGQVGASIARYLQADDNDITIVDESADVIKNISDSMDVRAIYGFPSHPRVLEAAGGKDADLFIAVTNNDEVNMVACQVAHSLFEIPTKIARIRHQGYLAQEWSNLYSHNHLPIDMIISPEVEIARAIEHRLQIPGAFETISLADDKLRVIGTKLLDPITLYNKGQFYTPMTTAETEVPIIAAIRHGKLLPYAEELQLEPGDLVYFIANEKNVKTAMSAFGHEEPKATRIVMAGGGESDRYLAELIEKKYPNISLKMIISDKRRAEQIANKLQRTVVIHGDALDPQILDEVSIQTSQIFIAMSENDEFNLLSASLAKKNGCPKTMVVLNSNTFETLVESLDIDVFINPRTITISKILQEIRRGRIRAVHSLKDRMGEVIEAEVQESSSLCQKPVKDIKFPAGVVVAGYYHDEKFHLVNTDEPIPPNSRVIVLSPVEAVQRIEKMFFVKLDFF